jgi:salicylate biosynthesis isochorismate synthase/menaquinone-specific isochorismate synthase
MALPRTRVTETPRFADFGPPLFAWSHPERSFRAAAWGEVDRREGTSVRELLRGLDSSGELPFGPWFGAVAFDPSRPLGRDWSGFSPVRFTLPALLAWSDGDRHFLATIGDAAQAHPDELRRADGPHARIVPRRGERERWDNLVARALANIASGALDKVVVARALDVESDADFDCDAIVRALEERYPTCRTFLLRGDGGAAFVGSTPETLCLIDGAEVYTEALAGSARPGEIAALLGNRKELREHRWVVDHLIAALGPLCDSLTRRPEPGVRQLANVAHLHTPVAARLAAGRSTADVAAALHPTPAVGGVPSEAALSFLAEHEQLDRGLYAGILGWVGNGRAELAVALRSALVRGRRARLFVGAGIVEGSAAAAEWAETELKARALLDALGASP